MTQPTEETKEFSRTSPLAGATTSTVPAPASSAAHAPVLGSAYDASTARRPRVVRNPDAGPGSTPVVALPGTLAENAPLLPAVAGTVASWSPAALSTSRVNVPGTPVSVVPVRLLSMSTSLSVPVTVNAAPGALSATGSNAATRVLKKNELDPIGVAPSRTSTRTGPAVQVLSGSIGNSASPAVLVTGTEANGVVLSPWKSLAVRAPAGVPVIVNCAEPQSSRVKYGSSLTLSVTGPTHRGAVASL